MCYFMVWLNFNYYFTGGLFGSTTPAAGTFGTPSFGSTTPAAGGGLFGGATSSQGTSLFGNKTTQASGKGFYRVFYWEDFNSV